MARKIVFRANAGTCGTDTAEGFIFPDNVTDAQLDAEAWQFGLEHAESYGVYQMHCTPEDYDEEDSGGDEYSDNIEGWWEEYDPAEHDGILTFGNADGPIFDDLT